MKVYLDDDYEKRHPPDGTWVRTRTAEETINLIKTGKVTHLSLDNDLGDGYTEGYVVLDWLEEEVCWNRITPPSYIYIHSACSTRNGKMEAVAKRILSGESARRFQEARHVPPSS